MAKEVVWTDKAKSDLNKIYEFNLLTLSEEKSFKIIEGIVGKVGLLYQPIIGSTRFISDLQPEINYYKIVYHQILIIYRVQNEIAYVIRIFDSRRDPKEIEL